MFFKCVYMCMYVLLRLISIGGCLSLYFLSKKTASQPSLYITAMVVLRLHVEQSASTCEGRLRVC
jgi:hypothetical protein